MKTDLRISPDKWGSVTLHLIERTISVPRVAGDRDLVSHFEKALSFRLSEGDIPIRFVVTGADDETYQCEVGCLIGDDGENSAATPSIFELRRRGPVRSDQFVAVFIVPTGIGAEVGGHAGDATPAAQLLASGCDQLVTNPNVVNASDINELPANALYVEGSVISRLLMGTVGLIPVRANRVLVVIDNRPDEMIENLALNTVEAARATQALDCTGVYLLEPPLELTAGYSASGRAIGSGQGIGRLMELLVDKRDDYDAVAISSLIDVPDGYHEMYFDSAGEMINPWGGIEAMLTHAVSHLLDVPSAHAPMMESREILFADAGRVDPRMAAEAISSSFFQCVLKGLKQSPQIVTGDDIAGGGMCLAAEQISCLVLPDGCIGLPVLAALEQGIPVIAVREGCGIAANDLTTLPWRPNQLFIVNNYWEASGVLTALRAGVAPHAVRRPFDKIPVETWSPAVSDNSPLSRKNR